MIKYNPHQYAIIIAGGIGSRFWPKSRSSYPKQFLDILHVGKTLIQATYQRFSTFILPQNIYVVTAEEYVPIVSEQLPMLPKENILAEPSRKNTAPCIAYASFKILLHNPQASMIVAPADHLILDAEEFKQVCNKAMDFVENIKALITLGINPTYPNTGYGYIQHEILPAADQVYKVKTFTEKPSVELAQTFLASGDFLWNAGIFVWKVQRIIEAFEKYLPEVYEVFTTEQQFFNTVAEKDALERIYTQCTNISIDFGIMEKADNVYVIPADFDWSDLGTWTSAYENLEKDRLGNAIAGNNVLVIDAQHCMIHAFNEKLLVIQGLDNYIVVDTPDALLICKKDKEQEIKEYVAAVKRKKGDKFL